MEDNKELSPYEMLKIGAKKLADTLPTVKNIDQSTLWLKSAIAEKVEEDEKVYTFRSGEKFGFSEHYVNLIIQYAYEKGRRDAYENATKNAQYYIDAIEKIKDIICDCE